MSDNTGKIEKKGIDFSVLGDTLNSSKGIELNRIVLENTANSNDVNEALINLVAQNQETKIRLASVDATDNLETKSKIARERLILEQNTVTIDKAIRQLKVKLTLGDTDNPTINKIASLVKEIAAEAAGINKGGRAIG